MKCTVKLLSRVVKKKIVHFFKLYKIDDGGA